MTAISNGDAPPTERTYFGSLLITFDDRVLRPRPWTVAQSRWATQLAEEVPPGPVLELCAGAGQIGLLTLVGTDRSLVSVDVSPVASSFTRRNAEAAGLHGRVETRTGPMDEVVGDSERFPLIVADPPWVPSGMTDAYPEDPLVAIDGGADGMDVVRTTLGVIAEHLRSGGAAVLQVGSLAQADQVAGLLAVDGVLGVAAVSQEERGVLVLLRRADDIEPSVDQED